MTEPSVFAGFSDEVSKPSVFVSSSSEGLEIARAVQTQLEDVGVVEVWNEGVFGPSSGTLESLVQFLDSPHSDSISLIV